MESLFAQRHLYALLEHFRCVSIDLTGVDVDVQRVWKVARGEGNSSKKATLLLVPAATVHAFLTTKFTAQHLELFDELLARTSPCVAPRTDTAEITNGFQLPPPVESAHYAGSEANASAPVAQQEAAEDSSAMGDPMFTIDEPGSSCRILNV